MSNYNTIFEKFSPTKKMDFIYIFDDNCNEFYLINRLYDTNKTYF